MLLTYLKKKLKSAIKFSPVGLQVFSGQSTWRPAAPEPGGQLYFFFRYVNNV